MVEKNRSIADVVKGLDSHFAQVKAFPDNHRPYGDLYQYVRFHGLHYLENAEKIRTIATKTTTGTIGKYEVSFEKGFLYSILDVNDSSNDENGFRFTDAKLHFSSPLSVKEYISCPESSRFRVVRKMTLKNV